MTLRAKNTHWSFWSGLIQLQLFQAIFEIIPRFKALLAIATFRNALIGANKDMALNLS